MVRKTSIVRNTLKRDTKWSVNRRYLGSKARIADWIISIVGKPDRKRTRFIDVFSGTGVVSREAAKEGWSIMANDHLKCAAIMTEAQLASKDSCRFSGLGGYKNTIENLNQLESKEGFVFREYSPSGLSQSGHIRYYFSTENAMKIDAIRAGIADWHDSGLLSDTEEALLLADLMSAADSVANTAGTYGCFLKSWQTNAIQPIKLLQRELFENTIPYIVSSDDYRKIRDSASDVAYVDPPYTKRQYAAYYHILETIAWGDEPLVEGVTGLRPWKEKSSDFCYKQRAEHTLVDVLTHLKSRRVILSYSSDGHMTSEQITKILSGFGKYAVHLPKHIPRYNANGSASHNKLVTESLFELNR